MNKFLRYSFALLLACVGFNAQAQGTEEADAVIDFSGSEDVWGIGTTKLFETQSFTYNGLTIKLTGTEGGGYRWYDSGNIILGKKGATLEFPAFDFDVQRIDIVGTSGASAQVKQNIFVGEDAVSTETTGAKDVTNSYNIAEGSQAAGTIYTLKVTSAHNTQITKILIYKKGTSVKEQAGLSWGKASATVTIGADDNIFPELSNPNNLPVTFNSSSPEYATINAEGSITLIAAGETEISASFAGNDQYEEQTVKYTLKIKAAIDPNAKGQVNNPYTVEEALEVINALDDGATTSDKFYVKGFVVGAPEIQKKDDGSFYGNANFYLADAENNGTSALYCFRLKGLENADIDSEDYIKEGDKLVVVGQFQKYVKDEVVTPEVKNGHIVSIEGGGTPDPGIPTVESQPVLKFTANGQWASYTFNKADFKAAVVTGFRIEYADMTGVDQNGGTSAALFNILVNSAETHLGKDWAGNDAQVPNKTSYKNAGFTPENTVFEGDFAEFVATDDPDTTCPTIGQFALQSCASGNSVVIKKVVFILSDGSEILPEYKGDDWGGGAYTIEDVTGISNINATPNTNGAIYNLAGQRVDENYRGIVIKNGKKVMQ